MKPSRFDYIAYDEKSVKDQADIKLAFQNLEYLIGKKLVPGRAASLVLTHLEEAYMWVGKSIRDTQIDRNKEATPQEERRDS